MHHQQLEALPVQTYASSWNITYDTPYDESCWQLVVVESWQYPVKQNGWLKFKMLNSIHWQPVKLSPEGCDMLMQSNAR